MEAILKDARKSIIGFDHLILATQGLLVGYFMAIGEVPQTFTYQDTLDLAKKVSDEYNEMTSAWGYEA